MATTEYALNKATRDYLGALLRRNVAICEARAEGMSLRQIAEKTGLSHEAVRLICREREGEAGQT